MVEEKTLEVYSNGMVHCSVCTNIENLDDIEKQVNVLNPTGIGSRWKISDNEAFRTGEPNPCSCEQKEGYKHYLMEC